MYIALNDIQGNTGKRARRILIQLEHTGRNVKGSRRRQKKHSMTEYDGWT